MELKKLEYLEAVHRHQNMTQAAAELYVAQPSITKAIRSLEQELGVQLLVRTGNSILFTAAGERLVQHAQRILQHVRRAEDEMRDFRDNSLQSITLALTTTAISWILPLIFQEFIADVPNCRFTTVDLPSSRIIEALIREQADLAYTIFPADIPSQLTAMPLHRHELRLVMAESHPLSAYKQIPAAALDNVPMLSCPEGALVRSILDQFCLIGRAVPIFQIVATQRSTTLELVAQGAGVADALIGPIPYENLPPNVVSRSLDPPFFFDVGILYRTDHHLNRAAKALIQFIKNKCEALVNVPDQASHHLI
ncbi:LysR family transcriptional regulator [bacterium 1XD21-13]|nr:LysR family transcriptional regulator [bacterium 1XD21-13]